MKTTPTDPIVTIYCLSTFLIKLDAIPEWLDSWVVSFHAHPHWEGYVVRHKR